jgi:hypothetical protein
MVVIREYDFAGRHYGLVMLDDGSKIEIKDKNPLTRACEMQTSGMFDASRVENPTKEKTISDFSDAEIVAEIKRRNIKQTVTAATGV